MQGRNGKIFVFRENRLSLPPPTRCHPLMSAAVSFLFLCLVIRHDMCPADKSRLQASQMLLLYLAGQSINGNTFIWSHMDLRPHVHMLNSATGRIPGGHHVGVYDWISCCGFLWNWRVAEQPCSDNSGEMPLRLEKQPTLFSCVKWFCPRRSLIMCKRVEFSFCYCHFRMYPLLVLSHLLSRGMHCHGVRAPHTAVRFLFWTHSFTLLLFFLIKVLLWKFTFSNCTPRKQFQL